MVWSPATMISTAMISTGQPRDRHEDSWRTVPFYQGILDQDPEILLASWADRPNLDDPRFGLVTGASRFVDYAKRVREWLVLSDATAEPLFTLNTPARSVEEVTLKVTVAGERRELPVAVVAEWNREHRLTSIRIYHSLWPLFPGQVAHNPQLSTELDVPVPWVVGENERTWQAGNVEAFLDTYEDGAQLRAVNGTSQTYGGKEQLRRFYSCQHAQGVVPTLEICAATDDGHACAVEYRVTHFDTPVLDESGITVYELGVSGKIHAERRYMGVAPCEREQ